MGVMTGIRLCDEWCQVFTPYQQPETWGFSASVDLQCPCLGDIFFVLLALASARAFYCPRTASRSTPLAGFVEHGLKLELHESLGRPAAFIRRCRKDLSILLQGEGLFHVLG